MGFKNFVAASRKPNLAQFGLLPSTLSLAWIESAALTSLDEYVHPTTITGTMNGVNDTFVLVGVSDTPSHFLLAWNGVVLEEGVGFTLSGGTLTMAVGYIPDSGDILVARIWS